jgi:ribonuclease P protein component
LAFNSLRGFSISAVSNKFSKQVRLNQATAFDAVFQARKKQSGRYFAIWIKTTDLAYPRLGLVVAKKNIRLATNRNRIKRVLRESFRQHQLQLSNTDIVIVVYQASSTLNAKELRQQIDNQWPKLTSCKKV